jgi:hypothetical protein
VSVDFLDRAAELLDGSATDPDAQARAQLLAECPTFVDLACRFDSTYRRTPALELLAAELAAVTSRRDGRLVISVPPQEGKTSGLRWLCAWLLARDPDLRIVYASYAATLARGSGRIVRSYVETHLDRYGLRLAKDHADASDWQLDGHRGGMVTVGVGGSLTGRPADLLIVDDPLRNQQDADSETVRENLHDWWSSVARTRLAPGAPVIVVQTRWVEDDLAGRRIAEGWPLVNIPALADGQTEDALGREPGTWLESARGRTVADWETTRRDVGERTFAALYQGRPAPLEGGIFKRAWFATWRIDPDQLPAGCAPPTVIVDPADNEGDGDEAGIILATTHGGKVFILDDLSAPMTVARWARVALLTCVRRDAPTLAYEQSLSQLPARIREAWKSLHQQAEALAQAGGDPVRALDLLARPLDGPEARDVLAAALAELTPDDAAAILQVGGTGPRLRKITAKGTKEARMLWAAPMFETGRAVLAGHFAKLEFQAATWQPGQDSPDRVDAMTHACSLATVPQSRVRWMGG